MEILHAEQALVDGTWKQNIQIKIDRDGRIASVGHITDAPTSSLQMALPAPVNLHSHSFQRAMAGLTEARGPDPHDSFWTWRRLMYRFLDQLSPDQVQAISAFVLMEMLEAGYAGVAEFHYLHHDVAGVPFANLAEMSARIIAAATETGIGLTLLPVFYQFGGCDSHPLAGGQRRFGNDPDQYSKLHQAGATAIMQSHSDYSIGVAPHSLRAVDQNGLQQAIALAKDGPIHMHLAEQVAEVKEVKAFHGARPAEWLLANHDVNERWCLIHCTQMNTSETRALARSGAVAGLCPITESNLGDGVFNGKEFLSANGIIGFGSDSNVHITLFEEMRVLEYSQRLRDRGRAVLATQTHSTGRILFDHALKGGSQAAGRNSGSIAPGKWADIIGIETDNHLLCNRTGDTALDTLIFGGHGQECIKDVWSAGRHVVKEGCHYARERIHQNFIAVMKELVPA